MTTPAPAPAAPAAGKDIPARLDAIAALLAALARHITGAATDAAAMAALGLPAEQAAAITGKPAG